MATYKSLVRPSESPASATRCADLRVRGLNPCITPRDISRIIGRELLGNAGLGSCSTRATAATDLAPADYALGPRCPMYLDPGRRLLFWSEVLSRCCASRDDRGEFVMRRFGLRIGTWALAGAVIASAAVAYAARPHVTSLHESGGHQLSTMRLIGDHPARDRGVLTYSRLTTVQARQTISFEVEVTDVGRGPERGTFARVSGGRFVAPQDVPTGGIVSVQSICSKGLTCTSRSSARQAIAGPGRSAMWRWDVAAKSPGEARILLVATSYRRGSKIVLDRTSDVVRVRVQATPLYFLDRSVDSDRAIVFLALAVLVVIGAVGAVLVLLRKAAPGKAATPRRADTSAALTEPLRIPVASIGSAAPARPTPGWSTLLWLVPVDIAAGGLAVVVMRATTTKSPAFAIVVGAVIAGALPLYFLPLITAYLRAAPDSASVAVINVLLGWTYLGWVAALALAVRDRPPDVAVGPGPGNSLPKYVTKRNPDGESGATHASQAALS
jgi:Superinfection immunity protein